MTDPAHRLAAALADHYRIERELGQGGMATVYLAHDVRHDRKVALKVLRPELSAILGADRFLAEIKTTANLQHPHILSLFDSGEADGLVFYVMPYVEGESLRDRIRREKQLPVDDAVRITREVADALDYAHRHGVVHRDIKPENILLHDGRAQVADFGIALAVSRSEGGTRMTETGMSLGTPHYMSPEQAMGEREITAKSDVYALGCVLYEMLTGEPPFTGPTAQAIIARVMTEEPRSLTLQRRTIPPHVEAAVVMALAKLPADRFASAAQFAAALADTAFSRTGRAVAMVTGAGGPWRTATAAAAGVALLATAVAAWALMRPAPEPPVSRFAVALDSGWTLAYRGNSEPSRLALTPDGRELVYVTGSLRDHQLAVRPLDRLESRALPGTQQAVYPAVSWDGAQVAYVTDDPFLTIRVASLRGGPPLTLVDSAVVSPPTWGPDGFVYFLDEKGAVRRVAGSGGPIEDVVQLPDPGNGAAYRWLRLLPDGNGALVAAFPENRADATGYALRAIDLRTGRLGASLQGVGGEYVAEAGALVYVTSDGTLMAVRFDAAALETRGRPRALFEGVSSRAGRTDLTAAGGTLAYVLPGTNNAENLIWVNRADGAQQVVDPGWSDDEYESFTLSPDGSRIAVTIAGAGQRTDVWIKQLDRGPLSRLTFGGNWNDAPAWTGDGRYVSYVSERGQTTSLWRRRSDGVGTEELVADIGRSILEARWSRDGAWLVASVEGPPSGDILVMRLGTDSALRPLLAEAFDEWEPALSPDSRWLAYVSRETGAPQVFVRPFPGVQDGKWQISSGGALDPVWSADGRELFFRSIDGQTVTVADMARGPSLAAPRDLWRAPLDARFEINAGDRMFEPALNGRRFLMMRQGSGDLSGNLVVVQSFASELRAALAGSN